MVDTVKATGMIEILSTLSRMTLGFPSLSQQKESGQAHKKKQFLTALSALEEAEFIEKIAYRGLSPCRLCDELNGNAEYVLQPKYQVMEEGQKEEREVCWPSGYHHYLQEHDVIPSKQFYDVVMKLVF
mmetsp:Transcript_16320/g.25353  ORF Transcript_16320/g.25353 Transcript_16320/m.25353 type:complete len:128 (-) Transcript_16320:49-432(-)